MIGTLHQSLRVIGLGLRSLLSHKLRSGLTILGIVFGVGSVISMLAIGEGASREVLEQIRRLGSQNIIVRSVKPPKDTSAGASNLGQGSNILVYGIKYADAERLASILPSVDLLVPIKAVTKSVRFKDVETQTQVLGTVPWYPQAVDLRIERGRFISSLDMHRTDNVCVIGNRLGRLLFRFRDPLGLPLRVGNSIYKVIGIVGDAPQTGREDSTDLPSQNSDLYVPITTLRAYESDLSIERGEGSSQYERVELHELILSVNDLDNVIPTWRVVEEDLSNHHEKNDFEVIVPLRLLENARRTQAIFSIVLGSIAAISLLVGGIGITNIMLASVVERTHEIGVRRALGARRRDIMMQFLVECLMLSIGGGIVGMALGIVIPWFVTRVSGMPTVLTPEAFILAFTVSATIGITFGLYPARRAALRD
ncbi:ABC transporter permease, partial [Candidatus Sumerlaeota bacterium]|nr:ABC transporter permease [Candidatus Sumerlaeota bacterium]